jgi:uncharacterized protein YcbK (DUF882 family)
MMVSFQPLLSPFMAKQPTLQTTPLQGINPSAMPGFPLGGSPMGEVDRMLQQVNAFTMSLQGWADSLVQESQQFEAVQIQALLGDSGASLGLLSQGSPLNFDSDAHMQQLLRGLYQQQSGGVQESVKAVKQAKASLSTATQSSTATSSSGSSSSSGKADSQTKIQLGKNNSDGSVKLASIGNGHQLQANAASQFLAASKAFKAKQGYDLPVISSYRSPEHNKRIGGSPTSNHTKGVSLDLDANALSKKGHYMEAVAALRAEGFEPLDGVTYVKHGTPQDEYNHFDYVGKSNTSNDWHGPKVS